MPVDFNAAVSLVARLNRDPVHHVGYLGVDPDDVAADLRAFEPLGLKGVVCTVDEGELRGVLGMDWDVSSGRAWLNGPFVDADDGPRWQALASELLAAGCALLPPGVDDHELCFGEGNLRGAAFAEAHGFKRGEASCTLSRGREGTPAASGAALFLGHGDHEAFEALHDRLFPGTYYAGRQIIERLGADERVLVHRGVGQSVLKGYIHVRRDRERGDAYIDFVGVLEDARRRGIGRGLVAQAVSWALEAEDVGAVRLTVSAEDVGTRRLYASLGFEETRVIRGFRRRR